MKCLTVILFAVLGGAVQAQQPVGSVAVGDAVVAGNLSVTNGRAVLVSNSTVTAKDHAAEISLDRGGNVLVCATSGLHITSGKPAAGTTPLMLSLDRGAIQLKMAATASDVIMTPDLRFGVAGPGPLDLRLGVTRNGDTCVDNRGGNAPVLNISDTFGESSYNLRPGQHVLFEHGDLKQVVDNESSPCGCPAVAAAGVSLADAAIASAKPASTADKPVEAKPVEEEHPFPAAVSAGLAPAPDVPKAPEGVVHAQVATTLSYDAAAASGAAPAAAPANAPETTAPSAAQSSQPATPPAASQSADASAAPAEPPAAPHSSDVAHWIGHFFKRLFGRG